MASINLGNFVNVNGKTVSSGMFSGIDTQAVVKDLVTAKQIPVTALQDKQTLTSNKISSYGDLKNLLSTFQSVSGFLRNAPSVGNSVGNLFTYRQAFVTSNTTVAGNTYVGVSADPGAQLGSYKISDVVLAKQRILRSQSFASQSTNVVGTAGTNNANQFSAGSFQITGGSIKSAVSTSTTNTIQTADYHSSGSVGTTVLSNTYGTGGISAITVTGNGDSRLIGDLGDAITGVTASQASGVGGNVTLAVTINGVTYTASDIAANTGGGNNQIAANTTLTFSNTSKGVSFSVKTGAAVTINNTTTLQNFASNIEADLGGITIAQDREISNFSEDDTADTLLNGLSSANVLLRSDEFDISAGTHGTMSAFQVNAVSANGAGDGSISVTIDGETYQATGLGNGSNLVTGNLVLTSLTSSKRLSIDLATPGISLNLSTAQNAKDIQHDLNSVFGTGRDINVDEGDSLVDIAAAINSQKTITGVSASVIQVSSTDFRLQIQADSEGVDNSFQLLDFEDVFTSTVTLNQTQAASNSSFTLNGDLSISRSTNKITDVIQGVNISLFQDSPGGTTLTLDIDRDTQTTSDTIISFINSYNEIRTFIATQRQRDPETGNFVDTAILGRESYLNSISQALESELNRTVSVLKSSDPDSLAAIGISFTDFEATDETPAVSNALVLDSTKLNEALTNNFEAVRRVFEFNVESSSSELSVYQRTNDLQINSFKVDVNLTRSNGDQIRIIYTDPDTNQERTINANFTATGTTSGIITGADGTVIEGLKLIYTGDGNDSITMNISQGVADRIFNLVDNYLKKDGLLDLQVNALNEQQDRVQREVDRMNEAIDKYRDQLLKRYSAMEQALAKAQSLIDYLTVQVQAQYAQK